MKHNELREDTECQNCGHTVEHIFCPYCGQKNTETRQSFGHLAAHFAEDFTHYDNAFWRTIKYLLFRPSRLTKEYLAGKRQVYVPPVKLYIFISFITFFLPALIPDFSNDAEPKEHATPKITAQNVEKEKKEVLKPSLTTKENVWFTGWDTDGLRKPVSYKTIREMDSIEALKPDSLQLGMFEHNLAKRVIKMYEHNTPDALYDKATEAFFHNIPKALFIYMPIFAFWLWLFHGKKRWYFFDHGIFTLHYFSFLLITTSFIVIFEKLAEGLESYILGIIFGTAFTAILFWQVYYFYRAHRKMYYESWIVNATKSTLLFFINFIAIIIVMVALLYVSVYTIH